MQLDAMIAGASAPQVVPELPLYIGGVDPLGMRQLNFGLMDKCIPGLNNAAWRLRPYTLMAWSWWRVARLAEAAEMYEVPVAVARAFVDRVEVMFQAGHLAVGEYGSLPGADGVRARILLPGGIDFSSATWRTWHGSRMDGASLMAPVSYGPSVKEGLGMGYLRSTGGAFVPVDEVMPAVLSLDARLAPALSHPALSSLECGWVPLADMVALHPLWSLSALEPTEIEVGRAALLGSGASAPRGATLDMVRAILRGADRPLSAVDVRTVAASRSIPGVDPATADLWRALQARQLVRVSLEGLLNWVLAATSHGPRSMDDLAADLLQEAGIDLELNFGQWLAAPSLSAESVDYVASPVPLIDSIDGATQSDRPDLCLLGLRAALTICRSMGAVEDLFGGVRDRLPMRWMAARLDGAGALPMYEAAELILSELVIGQHVFVAVGRSGDDTQRLRVVLDERGWVALQGAGHANPTPDRLSTLLELAADCKLIDRAGDRTYVATK